MRNIALARAGKGSAARAGAVKELNVFICGIGTVGGSLIRQIGRQQQRLLFENGLKINIIGIANTKHVLFDGNGVDAASCRDQLPREGLPSSSFSLRRILSGLDLPNPVFVDCTASGRIAGLYENLLANGVSVVAANKLAASSSQERYRRLKRLARCGNVKYLFETNVGAGLPIIRTIGDLVKSGDRILRIEAVLSGTLNYIFSSLGERTPLSAAVRKAWEEGYSEPDPRIDLSGTDVVRKLVILAREAGCDLEPGSVEQRPFLPEACFEGGPGCFWRELESVDAVFEAERARLEKQGRCRRFVARLEDGKASVGLAEIDRSHPFAALQGSNNMVLLTTERYRDYPLVIQGYGAGAEVTAAGVFADIISIAHL